MDRSSSLLIVPWRPFEVGAKDEDLEDGSGVAGDAGTMPSEGNTCATVWINSREFFVRAFTSVLMVV